MGIVKKWFRLCSAILVLLAFAFTTSCNNPASGEEPENDAATEAPAEGEQAEDSSEASDEHPNGDEDHPHGDDEHPNDSNEHPE